MSFSWFFWRTFQIEFIGRTSGSGQQFFKPQRFAFITDLFIYFFTYSILDSRTYFFRCSPSNSIKQAFYDIRSNVSLGWVKLQSRNNYSGTTKNDVFIHFQVNVSILHEILALKMYTFLWALIFKNDIEFCVLPDSGISSKISIINSSKNYQTYI